MKRLALLTVLVLAAATPSATAQAVHRPTQYVVSTTPGENLEGIAVTPGGTMYVTSVATGAVYRGTTHSSRLSLFLPAGGDGRTAATGIHLDRWGRVLVAGAGTSKLFLYDARGRLLAVRKASDGSFLNDFTIAGNFVYVTDSAHNQIWRAPLTRAGLGELEPWIARDQIKPTPYFLNGIVTDGRVLLVGEQGQDVTYRIDLRTKQVTVLDVPNGILSGDGYLLEGRRLYAVHNAGGGKYVTRLAILNDDLTAATLVADSGQGATGATPTTIARDHGRLLWVNSQLDIAPGTPPYTVTVVPGLR
ncbi:superoxide dismutase [Kribbella sindirgiensis]|uniref:Superoxide dismutase n=1 Tax=Kribbella sindirgiensis TaxID=1124744 RepID=A0A4R0IF32_9ACTN|nr:superoxide dismutase [Kribbella sindirgiensis]TCC29816.1 superoxide dismutase [Kribbella sindirgiensis]